MRRLLLKLERRRPLKRWKRPAWRCAGRSCQTQFSFPLELVQGQVLPLLLEGQLQRALQPRFPLRQLAWRQCRRTLGKAAGRSLLLLVRLPLRLLPLLLLRRTGKCQQQSRHKA